MAGPYEKALTIPAGTPEDKPVSVSLTVEGDVVTQVDVDYPGGCHGLVLTAIFYGIKQVWPREEGTWFRANGYVITFRPEWDMPEHTAKLVFKGCSPDATYSHKIGLRIHTADMPEAKPWKVMYNFTEIIKKLVGLP